MKAKHWILTGVLIGGAIVTARAMRVIKKLKKARYDVGKGFKVRKLSKNEVVIRIVFWVENPSDINMVVTRQKYDVLVNGWKVGEITNANPYRIDAQSKSYFPLDIRFDPKDIIRAGKANLTQILNNPNSLRIRLKGRLTLVSGFFYVKGFPLDLDYTLAEWKSF